MEDKCRGNSYTLSESLDWLAYQSFQQVDLSVPYGFLCSAYHALYARKHTIDASDCSKPSIALQLPAAPAVDSSDVCILKTKDVDDNRYNAIGRMSSYSHDPKSGILRVHLKLINHLHRAALFIPNLSLAPLTTSAN